jgi:hypothetical protein
MYIARVRIRACFVQEPDDAWTGVTVTASQLCDVHMIIINMMMSTSKNGEPETGSSHGDVVMS